MAHGVSENIAHNKVFIYEPHLITQLAELISPENDVNMELQTFAFYALDAIARHRNKLSDTLSAINASANHGIIMQILRKVNTNEEYSQSFLEALLSFVSCLLQTQPGGQMLMSAGIIPILIQIIGNNQYNQLKNIAKIATLLDTIVNSFNTSFAAFCNADGLNTLLERIKREVETTSSHQTTEQGNDLHDRLSAIKAMLRFLLRMMESSGTADGLRNLIDSSLPQTLKSVMDNPKLFGNSIFALAININTTLIHNEATSLPILQEAKLPQSFLRTISTYETPNNEVLLAAVNAFGAICLNAQGLDMFNQVKPLPHFFDLITSNEFLRNPIDIDCATALGSTMDELVRHHPSLKPSVFECVTTMVKKVLEMGNDMNGPGKANDNSHLIQTRSANAMDTDGNTEEEDKSEKFECLLVSFIDMVSRFLEGLFQNTSNIKEFVEKGCPEMLLDYYSLPLLPANFSVTLGSDSLAYIFRMISEVSPLPTMMAIVTKIKESLGSLLDPRTETQKSILIDYVDVHENEFEKVNEGSKLLRQLIQTHAYVGLLSNLCCSSVFSHGKNGVSLATEFLSESGDRNVIQLLGQLHRIMVWENLLFKEAIPPAWYAFKHTTPSSPSLRKNITSTSEHPLGIYNTNTDANSEENSPGGTSGNNNTSQESVPPGKDPRMLNIKHFKLIVNEIPQLVMPVFQVLIKVSVSRRAAGPLQKPQTMKLAESLADLLKDDIKWLNIMESSTPCKYDYLTSTYTMASLLLRDERTQTSLQTPIALAFDRRGGINLLLMNLNQLWNEALQIHSQHDEKKEKTLKRIDGTIESLLSVIFQISSPKALRDSPCTAFLINKDKKASDYFDPFEWIVALEHKFVSLKEYLTNPHLHLFSKSAIQTLIKIFLQIMKGEGDFSIHSTSTRTSDPFSTFTAPLMASPFTLLRTPAVASEQNIQMLVEMGFERGSAEQALVRCNNQVSRAVDYLFSHPTPVIGNAAESSTGVTPTTNISAPEATEETNATDPVNSEQQIENINDLSTAPETEEADEDDDIESQEDEERSDMDEDELEFSMEAPSENVEKLKQIRHDLCTSLPPFLLPLADERDDIVFDVRDLLVVLGKFEDKSKGPAAKSTNASIKILALLLDRIEHICTDSSKSSLLSSRFRLLALLLREPPMQATMFRLPDRFSFLFGMLQFSDEDQLPAWTATLFLVLEAFISQADEPKKDKRSLPNQASSFSSDNDESGNESSNEDVSGNLPSMEQGRTTIRNISSENCRKLLECCVALLKRTRLSRDIIYAVYRMIVRLTKKQEYASLFVDLGGIPLLVTKPKSNFEGLRGHQAFIILILRHVIESECVLRHTMKDIIVSWFTNPRPRNTDITSFVRTNAHIVLREPSMFIEVTSDICRLAGFDGYEVNRQIKLKKHDKSNENANIDEEKKSSEVVIHFLLNEIMATRAEAIVHSKKESKEDDKKQDDNIKFVYIGFLLQYLVELISSYPSCKYDIFKFCKKQNGYPRTPGAKHRSFVSMLINDLLPYNHINPYAEESRKQQGISTWTASTLVAMCYDPTPISEMSAQQKNELFQVRKYVLEAIVRSLKDAIASNETATVKYSKYIVLSDLCNRILNARLNVGSSLTRAINIDTTNDNDLNKEDAAMSNSRVMLDKNFVAVLTSAVNDVDINYPHSKAILNAMLRPLELLTRLAINNDDSNKDSNADSNKDDPFKMDTAEEGLQLPENPADENEGAPDLYRNSALGMYNRNAMEEEHNSDDYSDIFGSSVEEEEEFDEDSGSDLSDMSEGEGDEDGDEEMEAVINGYDSDEMDEDDDSEDMSAEAELIGDEEGNREMTWHLEDIEDDSSIIRAESIINEEDERGEQSPAGVMELPYDEEEDELDALSDFEDASENLDAESETDVVSDGMVLDVEDLDTPFLQTEENDDYVEGEELEGAPRSIIPIGFRRRLPHARRALLEGVGRTMRTPGNANGQEDVITHPLLSNNPGSQATGGSSILRNSLNDSIPRRGHGAGFSNWQEFEDIIGGSTVRMLESILANAPSGSHGSHVRVDISNGPSGVFRSAEFERPPNPQASRSEGASGTANDDIQKGLALLHDFQPMTTGERWNQEARMMYGTNLGEKSLKVVNTMLNILVPVSIEEGKEEKRRLEKEARQAVLEAIAQPQESTEAIQEEEQEEEQPNNDTQEAEASSNAMDTADTGVEPTETAAEERTTVVIHGEHIDISGTGIDVEFLEALPDDLREEVINQHMRNRPQPSLPAEDDSISPEFLDALPADIREEVLNHEAIERERRDRQNRQATHSSSNLANSASAITSTVNNAARLSLGRSSAESENDDRSSAKKKNKQRRRDAAAQLIEKSQLATLVRLLFIPQTISKSLLNRLLLNLCENSKSRSDLLSYLVCVLYDGNTDLTSVDNSFNLFSSGKMSKNAQKSTKSLVAPSISDSAPNYVTQRCLEALSHIISCNEQSLAYFLTESESLADLKRPSSIKKGKGKEKISASWNKYPILVLISLLDRPVFINNPSLMEQLMELLSIMCRPFPVLVKKYQEKLENKQKDTSSDEKPMPKPPTILDSYLKLIVHVLTNGECSSKTFQYTLNAISHLSALDGAQQAIVNELVTDAKGSGAHILKDLENLVVVLENSMPGTEVSSNVLASFSASTSYQAKLLRVLKTLDYMFTRKWNNSGNSIKDKELQAKNEKQVSQIYEELDFLPLWQALGNCLSVVREKEDLINVATVLLPLIESFMVVSKCTSEKDHEQSTVASESSSTDSFFFTFTEKHKKVLNIMVRNNPALMSGSFALLVCNPKMLEFDNKRNYFVQQLHKRTASRENYSMLKLNVRRQYVFEDSYHQLQGRTGDEIKYGKLSVLFYDEEGLDAGGVTREWFSVLARQMFDPNYALFITSAADKLTYQPNRASAVNPDHLSFFKFVGRVIGKAIYDGRLLDAYFTRSFYKHILGRPVDYRDVEAIDPEYYKSLVWMLENDITDIIDLTFSIETDYFGTKETVDLKPDGRNIPVTEANKHEYVTLVTEQKLTTAIKDQINAFVQGFHDIIPAHLIQIFNEQELELLISGLPDIDIDDWKNNTEYEGYSASSPPIQWFWRAVRSFDQEERAKLLQFATGTSKVPLEGFAHLQGSSGIQKFQIHKDFGGEKRLPSAHTCFNQIDLPQYDSEQGYAEEVTGEVMISLMSMMRIKYELGPGAMEISEVLQEPSDFKSREEEENMYNLKKESEAEKSYGTPIQSKIEVFFNVHTGKADLNKKRSTYRSYNPNQIGCFLLLVIEKFPVKTAAADAGINLSSTYWFKKLEKKAQFSQTKKDGLIKGSWPT
ncbi:hypothetical protein RO3G_06597 [Rhizopus delemar RA 99-880]|uniref:HECT-type E3 ubiquitin transferase n=1 Tax=Rhizopus delemar (strain RA 99-880 / ATCC MYA-4621 / FGSC 9543 / NRRL 43880) TaxID=246409 RepID=I1C0B2_RHIO9|nr:hypothetical protein RO3G_06597 [Rhizopus delemar RA 99-880]|eukprot:EIE81892.1 hypothetical protein RO3G_06597 [Rhizopus delemar RA 99-880]